VFKITLEPLLTRLSRLRLSSSTSFSLFWKFCALALLAALLCVLCSRLSHPWTYNDDYNGAFWSQAARNFSRNGFLSTAGVPAPLYFGPPPVPRDELYVHHPTLLPALMFLDYDLLGGSESAARALPIFFSMLAAAALWLFAANALGWRGAAFVLAFFVAQPMELHYGQMVNFEAPELFFLLAAFCCFHLWRSRRTVGWAIGLFLFCSLAIWTDWLGYLLVILLAVELLIENPARNARFAAALLLTGGVYGFAFLLQVHLALPGGWRELFDAFRERSGNADLSGGKFTAVQWLRVQFADLTTLFNPLISLLAAGGAAAAIFTRGDLSESETALLRTGASLFLIDAFYLCLLRNQSYIHDFAGFYFLIPLSIFSGFLIDRFLRWIEQRFSRPARLALCACCCAFAGFVIYSGVRSLAGIDTQFCILDDDESEPPNLMPDLGRLIDRAFSENAVVVSNFDPYYSPLPFYARRQIANGNLTYADWRRALADASPQPAGGIVWLGDPSAPDLVRRLPAAETRKATVDNIPFLLWLPPGAARLE
jgi:4-amino-4-deoxy-L-arabinose transferase-like glycosyltransferase